MEKVLNDQHVMTFAEMEQLLMHVITYPNPTTYPDASLDRVVHTLRCMSRSRQVCRPKLTHAPAKRTVFLSGRCVGRSASTCWSR